MSGKVRYIKIARIDGNGVDITDTLESVTSITIPLSVGNRTYPILNRTRQNDFYLYYINPPGNNDIPVADHSTLDYNFTSSLSTASFSQVKIPGAQVKAPMTIDGEETQIFTNNILLGSSNQAGPTLDGTQATINTYPQKQIKVGFNFTASITSGDTIFQLYQNNGDTLGNNLAQTSLLAVGTHEETLSVTLPSTSISPKDGFSLVAFSGGAPGFILEGSFNSTSYFFASSSAATGPTSTELIIEPFLTQPFFNSDCDVMQGEVEGERSNPFLQDVDYSTSTTIPVNVEALASGSATRATVPESYYTALSQTNNRYNGTKNQTEKINEWTESPNNIGTYGKTPPVELKNVLITYCDWIGGLNPDLKGYSAAHIKFIINEDDAIREPNLTREAIRDIQNAFPTGENCIINLLDPPPGSSGIEILNGDKEIFRGGYRVEPVLYTQIASSPGAYTESINLIQSDNSPNITNITVKNNFLPNNNLYPGMGQPINTNFIIIGKGVDSWPNGAWNPYYDPDTRMRPPSVGSYLNYEYNVSSASLAEGVGLQVDAGFYFVNENPTYSTDVTVRMWKNDNQTLPGDLVSQETVTLPPSNIGSPTFMNITYEFTPGQNIIATDEIFFEVKHNNSNIPFEQVYMTHENTYWNIFQTPLPNPLDAVDTPIWAFPTGSYNGVLYNEESSSTQGIIYAPNPTPNGSTINNYYNSGVKQETIPSSGFFPTILDWSLEIGDEFRFNDREDRVWIVKEIFEPQISSSNKLSPSGSLEVHLTEGIISGSINLNHFFIRRFVEDGSFIYFKVNKPSGASGASIIKPQYVTTPLEKDSESLTILLAERGLIT